SRRRHTRSKRDWSSDVCSSDLNELYEQYGRYIYHLCLKLTRNKEEAEDVMQDVWVKVIRYEDKLADIDNIKGWLTTICMNTFREIGRASCRDRGEKSEDVE